jgi:hypothetical protein
MLISVGGDVVYMVFTRVEHAIERVRQPEYTGENRCLPCTVTNLGIAGGLTLLVGWTAYVTAGVLAAGLAAGLVFAVSLAAIGLRGYLVPGTPELTKRYFPDWLLAAFGKETERPGSFEIDESVDVEAALWGANVLEEKPHGDLGLTDAFQTEWHRRMATQRGEETGREAMAGIVGIDPAEIEFQEFGGGAFVALHGQRRLGRWESRAAFLADAAGGDLLPEYYDDWDVASPTARGQLLAGLRLFIEQCPACEGEVRFGREIVESCCRSFPVVAVTCADCNARLFEVDATDEMLEAEAAA